MILRRGGMPFVKATIVTVKVETSKRKGVCIFVRLSGIDKITWPPRDLWPVDVVIDVS